MDWRAHGDMLCPRLARADPDDLVLVSQDGRPVLACAWDMAILEQKRRAWIAQMKRERLDHMAWMRASATDIG